MGTVAKPDNLRIDLPLEALAALCRRHDVEGLWVFGSALRDDFRADSDVDFLVQFRGDDAGPWMSRYLELERDLSELLGRKVDLVDRGAVEHSENYLRRRHILGAAEAVYVA